MLEELGGVSGQTREVELYNYVCMPDDPDYLVFQPGVQGKSPVTWIEYEPQGGPLDYLQIMLHVQFAISQHELPQQ